MQPKYTLPGQVQILGLNAPPRGGKDYLAERTVIPVGFLPVGFALHPKVDMVVYDGLPINEAFFGDKSEAGRRLMQTRMNDDAKPVHGNDIWVRVLDVYMAYFVSKGITKFVIQDVRFLEEIAWIHNLGGKIYKLEGRGGLVAGGLTNATAQHKSETVLQGFTGFDRVFDNSPANEHRIFDQVWDALAEDFGLQRPMTTYAQAA